MCSTTTRRGHRSVRFKFENCRLTNVTFFNHPDYFYAASRRLASDAEITVLRSNLIPAGVAATQSKTASLTYPPVDTKVAALVGQLSADSEIGDFRSLAAVSESDLPHEFANSASHSKRTRRNVRASCVAGLTELPDPAGMPQMLAITSRPLLDDAKVKYDDAATKRGAANLAASQAFSGQHLAGVGEGIWQEMWKAARRYSEHVAYPGEAFPHVGTGAVCVLCQQPLATEARIRLASFEVFIQADTEKVAEDAERELRSATAEIFRVQTGLARYRDWRRRGALGIGQDVRHQLWEVCAQASKIQRTIGRL